MAWNSYPTTGLDRDVQELTDHLEAGRFDPAFPIAIDLQRRLLLDVWGREPRNAISVALAMVRVADTVLAVGTDGDVLDLTAFAKKVGDTWTEIADPMGFVRLAARIIRIRIGRQYGVDRRYPAFVSASMAVLNLAPRGWVETVRAIREAPHRRDIVGSAMVELVDRLRLEQAALVRDLCLLDANPRAVDVTSGLGPWLAGVATVLDPYAGPTSATSRRINGKRVLTQAAHDCLEYYSDPDQPTWDRGIDNLRALSQAFDAHEPTDRLGLWVVGLPARDEHALNTVLSAPLAKSMFLTSIDALKAKKLLRDARGLGLITRRRFERPRQLGR